MGSRYRLRAARANLHGRREVIARYWSAETTSAQAPAYAHHLKTQVMPSLRKVDGYMGATLLERTISGAVEIIVITWWRTLESIRGFAGADIEQAVVADEAAALLTQFDDRVRHYELVSEDGDSPAR